jgi:putative transposase
MAQAEIQQELGPGQSRVRKLHSTIANVRPDFLHKSSTAIGKNHALVYIEDMKVAQMSKGSKAQLGKNVKAKSGLNQSILEQGWSAFAPRNPVHQSGKRSGTISDCEAMETESMCQPIQY